MTIQGTAYIVTPAECSHENATTALVMVTYGHYERVVIMCPDCGMGTTEGNPVIPAREWQDPPF